MADNQVLPPPADFTVAADEIGGVKFQRVKVAHGADGTAVDASEAAPFPVTVVEAVAPPNVATEVSAGATATALGGLTDAEATGSGSVIAILKRLRTLLGGLGLDATLQAIRDRLPSALVGGRLDVNVGASTTLTVTHGGLTNSELRASAVPVSVSGGVEITNDSGSAISVSAASLPLPTDAATQTTLEDINTKTPALGQATMAASAPVVIASNQSVLSVNQAGVSAGGSLGALNAAQALSLVGASGWSVDVRGTFVGTITFQGTVDGTNWPTIALLPIGGVTNVASVTTTTAVGAWWGNATGLQQVRAIMTAYTSGSATVTLRAMQAAGVVTALLSGSTTVPVSGTVTANLGAATTRAGFVAGAGIWYDDSATALAANATFTGTSRDATVTATAVAFANAATYAQEVRLSAESDVAGTLWLEVSRDNTNWRRVKSVATAAISGGGQYAEVVHRPSWRYWRVGFTNGATIQARFSIGSLATGV